MLTKQTLSNWLPLVVVVAVVFLMLLGGLIAHLIIYGEIIKWIIKTLILSCT